MLNEYEPFTDEEKYLITSYLCKPPGGIWIILQRSVYVIPSLIFAIYGFVKWDLMAILVTYIALLIYTIWDLCASERSAKRFHSVIRKYEADAGALRKSSPNLDKLNKSVEHDAP
jgi:hypothetical protein